MACPLANTGWTITVEAYYNTGGRLYGDLNYGDEFYGDLAGAGAPQWNDITEHNVDIEIVRGDQEGAIEPPISELRMECLDPDHDLWDFATPATYFDPDTGAPIRVRVTDPLGASYTLTTQLLDRILDVHRAGVRVIQIEAFDLLSQYAQPLYGWAAPAQNLTTRITEIATAVEPAIYYGPTTYDTPGVALVADPVATDPEDDEQNGIDLMRIAAASAGQDLDTTAEGELRFRTWPLPWLYAPDTVTVVDCDDTGLNDPEIVVATEMAFVQDLASMVNTAIVEHRDTPGLDARAEAIDSRAIYSPRKEALGWPIDGAVHADQTVAQALADRTRDRYGGVVNRPLYVVADVRRDPRWLPILAQLDTGTNLLVRRTGVRLVEHRCIVVGFEHVLNPREGWQCRIYLTTIEPTIGSPPPSLGARTVRAAPGVADIDRTVLNVTNLEDRTVITP